MKKSHSKQKIRFTDLVHQALDYYGCMSVLGLAQTVYRDRYPTSGQLCAVKRALNNLGAGSTRIGAQRIWYFDAQRLPGNEC